ncbi:MAG: nitroreductase [Burkholderiales bacterium]
MPSPAPLGLHVRRSVSPRRLGTPGPSSEQLEIVVRAALRAPDHGALTPWRAVNIPGRHRENLAQLFAEEKRRRDPLVSTDDLARAREHALNAPTLLAFVVCPRTGVTVPLHEQWLAAGAALGNMLNAFHALGFGAIVLSGDRCADTGLTQALGLHEGERLAGFVSAGTVLKAPPVAQLKPIDVVWSEWEGAVGSFTPLQAAPRTARCARSAPNLRSAESP